MFITFNDNAIKNMKILLNISLFPKRDETTIFERKYITNSSSKVNIAPYFNNYKIKIKKMETHV